MVCSRGQRLRCACDLGGADCWLVRLDEVCRYVDNFVAAAARDLPGPCTGPAEPHARAGAGPGAVAAAAPRRWAAGAAPDDHDGGDGHGDESGGRAAGAAGPGPREEAFLDAVRTAGRYAFQALSAVGPRITFELCDKPERQAVQREALLRLGLKELDAEARTLQLRFQHRTFLEYFAARHMKEHLRDTVGALPLAATRRIVWLFLADMLRSDADAAARDAFTDAVAGRFREQAERYSAERSYEVLLEAPPPEDAVPVALIVELATVLSPEAFFDRLQRGWFRRVVLRSQCPEYFWWMVEHCGTHYATSLLECIHRSLTELHGCCCRGYGAAWCVVALELRCSRWLHRIADQQRSGPHRGGARAAECPARRPAQRPAQARCPARRPRRWRGSHPPWKPLDHLGPK